MAEANLAARRALEADAFLSGAKNIIERLFWTSLDLDRDEDAVQWCEEGRRRFPESAAFLGCALVRLATAEAVEPDVDSAWGLFHEYVEQLSGAQELFPEREQAKQEMIVAAVLARAGLTDSARAVMSRVHAATGTDDSSFSFTELYVRMLVADALFDSLAEGLKSDPADTIFLTRDSWGRLVLRNPLLRARLEREQ